MKVIHIISGGLMALAMAAHVHGQTGAVSGFCNRGGVKATTFGTDSSNYMQGVVPSCTVTVYLTGTLTPATIYADAISTPLSNPFTANAVGSSAAAQWVLWAATGQGLDVYGSGGIEPNIYPSPTPLMIDVFPSGGGGGGGGGDVQYVALAPSGACSASPPVQVVTGTGVLYTCNSGTWAAIGIGSVSGTFTPGIYPIASDTATLGNGSIDFGVTTPNVLTITTPIVVGPTHSIAIFPQGSNVSNYVQLDAFSPSADAQVKVVNGAASLKVIGGTGTVTEDSSGNIVHNFNSTYQMQLAGVKVLDYGLTFSNMFTFAQGFSVAGLSGASPLCANGTNNAITNIGCSGAGSLIGTSPIVVSGFTISCPTCGVSSGGTNVSQNSGSTEANLPLTGFMPQVCSDSSGSGTVQVCSTTNTFTPQSGNCWVYKTTTTNSGAGLTVNVNSLGAKSVAIPGLSGWTTTLTANIIPPLKPLTMCYDGTNMNIVQTGTLSGSLSGMTPAQVAVAGSANTITGSKAIAGSGAALASGPTSSTSGDVVTYTGTAGQTQDSGTLLSSLAPKANPTFTGNITTPITGSTQCVHVNSSGVMSGSGFDCPPTPIANIQVTTGTTLISANTCTGNTATAMTGVATTSAFSITPTASTTAVTGWGSTGGLVFSFFPTTNTFNWSVCNQTGSNITPSGSVTWNVGAK